MKALLLGLAFLAAPALAGEPSITWNQTDTVAPEAQARIVFARQAGIFNWAVTDENSLYIQGRDRQWYRAEFMNRCIGLRFAHTIGFRYEPDGSLDKFSSIRSQGQRCPFTSLVKSDPPPGHKGKATPVAKVD